MRWSSASRARIRSRTALSASASDVTRRSTRRITLTGTGPFRDGRSGYVFAVNLCGARYDGIVESGGVSINAQWAVFGRRLTACHDTGWSADIRIPIQTLELQS